MRKFDPSERDFRNRALGKAGEALVFDFERARPAAIDRADLARKVRSRRRTATERATTSTPSIPPAPTA